MKKIKNKIKLSANRETAICLFDINRYRDLMLKRKYGMCYSPKKKDYLKRILSLVKKENFQEIKSEKNQIKKIKKFSCTCRKISCMKKYCECMKNKEFCDEDCSCKNCRNREGMENNEKMKKNIMKKFSTFIPKRNDNLDNFLSKLRSDQGNIFKVSK
jgi:hypothetical protein